MDRSTSVLVFATQHMPTGGIESHLQEFCLHLAKTGVKIDLVVTNSRMLPETKDFFRQICRRVYLGESRSRFIWLLLVVLKLRFKHYNALYTNGQGKSVFFISKLLISHNEWVLHHHTSGDVADQTTWDKDYWKALLKANRVIACSQRNAKDMSLVLKRSVDVIPCFSRQVKLTATGLSESNKLRFGYYGRLIPEKGIDLLCKLSEDVDLQEIEFHIWGEGPNYSLSTFKSFTNISYHGSFNGDEQLASVLSSLDALLLLSTHPEGLPISLLEAMSAGLPWLATDRGGIPDIALDPSSTRVISSASTYSEIKNALILFAIDLKAGHVSKQEQIDLYTKKFSSSVLVSQWREVLGLN